MASVNDKITDVRNGARPNSARVTVARLVAGTTLQCNSLVGWPTASKVHFVTYQVDSNNDAVPSTQIDCSGIVSGNDITQITVIDGTDAGNSIGDVVEMLPTAAWGQDLADALSETLERDGSLKDDIVGTDNIDDDAVTTAKIDDDAVTTAKIPDDAITAPKLSGIAKDNLTVDSNPYKFAAYRSSSQSVSGVSTATIIFDTELFDTNSNYDNSTGIYTAPVTGFYFFHGCVTIDVGAGGEGYVIYLFKNSGAVRQFTFFSTSTGTESMEVSGFMSMTATDTVKIAVFNSVGSARGVNGSQPESFFEGFLVSRT